MLEAELPVTLMSVFCLDYRLAGRRCYDESVLLYERACTAYSTALGEDHPTTCAYRQHYLETACVATHPLKIPDSGVSIDSSKRL